MMNTVRAVVGATGVTVAEEVRLARSFWARGIGLLGRSGLSREEGLLISPCKSIHSFLMRFAFDAVYLDRHNRVVALVRSMRPQRFGPLVLSAKSVLELPAGKIDEVGLSPGDELVFSS